MRSLSQLPSNGTSLLLLLLSLSSLPTLLPVGAFAPGVEYTYEYESRVLLSELGQQANSSSHSAQLVLSASISLSRLQFANGLSAVRLRFLTAEASNGLKSTGPQDLQPPSQAAEFLLTALEPSSPAWFGSIIAPEADDPFWLNLARGVASLLRHRRPDGASASVREADAMGECGVDFAWQLAGRRLEKRVTECENVELSGERDSANPLFAVRRIGGNATVVFDFATEEAAAPPTSAVGREAHELLPDLPVGFGLRATAETRLRLVGETPAAAAAASSHETLSAYLQSSSSPDGGRPTREVALPTSPELHQPDTSGSLAEFLTGRLPSYLRDGSPAMHALAIVQGLPLARGARDQAELRKQLELPANRRQLAEVLELYAACGTKQCLGALFDFVAKRLAELPDPLLERLLLALAQSSRPGRPLLARTRDLLARLEAAGGRSAATAAAYHALATLARKFATTEAAAYGGGGLDFDVPELLLARLAACDTDEDCQLAALSAMANCPSGRYRRPLLRGLLANATDGSELAAARIRALRAAGPLASAERRHLAGLLRQRHVPLSAPIRYALVQALDGPASCGADCDGRGVRANPDLWLPLRRRHRLPAGHEEVLAGLTSSAFHRGRMFSTDNDSVDFELDLLGNRLGGMRRSDFRLLLSSPSQQSSDVLGVRLFADAVDSLLDSDSGSGGGTSDDVHDLTEEATAGLQLSVLGEWLPPRRFFTGSSGLMSAVWNAPEEPATVLLGGFELHDFASRLHLHNGLVVEASLVSALGLNVSGSLSVSIWNRDAASRVLNSVGVALNAKAGIRTGRFSLDFVSQAHAELTNTFATFVNFAEAPVRTCLAMSNSPLAVTHNCHVTDSLGPRYDHHSHDRYVPGRSFSLGGRNDRTCVELAPGHDDE